MINFSPWILLLAAGFLDVLWAFSMKKNAGFVNISWSLISLMSVALFIWLLSRVLQTIPLGIAYAVWSGIGTLGTVIVGIVIFNEPVNIIRLSFIAMIAIGIIGLHLHSI